MNDSMRVIPAPRKSMILGVQLLLALLALLVPGKMSAQMVVPLTIEEMAGVAEDVVHGTVTETKTGIYGGKVYTLSTVSIHESFKGSRSRGQTIDVVSLGGKVGPLTAEVPGAPKLKEADEVIVFLSNPVQRAAGRRSEGAPQINLESPFAQNPQVVGGFQGRFEVVRDTVEHELPGGRRVEQVIPRVVRRTPGQKSDPEKAPTLDNFTRQLREALNPTVQRRTSATVATVGEVQVPVQNKQSDALRFFDPQLPKPGKPRTIEGTVIQSRAKLQVQPDAGDAAGTEEKDEKDAQDDGKQQS